MADYAIVLSVPALVRGKMEPSGSVFYENKTIGNDEAQSLIDEKKAKRMKVQEPEVVGGYFDDNA